jgi:hypothetical protein
VVTVRRGTWRRQCAHRGERSDAGDKAGAEDQTAAVLRCVAAMPWFLLCELVIICSAS